jgi:tetratricopeptide (TPR) repeat protein
MLGDIQGEMEFANLGDTKGSLESYNAAESLHRSLMASTPPSQQNRRGLMVIQQRLAMAYLKTGHPEQALRVLGEAGKTADELAQEHPDSEQAVVDLFVQQERLSMTYGKLGETAKGVESNRRLLQIAQRLAQIDTNIDRRERSLVLAFAHLAETLPVADAAEAGDLFRKARGLATSRATAKPNDGEAQTDLGVTEMFEARFLLRTGRTDEALAMAKSAQNRLIRMAEADAENREAQKEAADTWYTLGEIYTSRKGHANAVRAYQESVRMLEDGAVKDPLDVDLRSSLATSYLKVGEVREKLNGCPDALPWYRKSQEQWAAISKQQSLSPNNGKSADATAQGAARCAN